VSVSDDRIKQAEHEIELMQKDCEQMRKDSDQMRKDMNQMLVEMTATNKMMKDYGEKYTKILDEIIEEKKDNKEIRKLIRDKLVVGFSWLTVVFIFTSAAHYLKSWIKI